ncbi:MAG: hypothetical protein KGI87_06300, partial [Burkholderiales bacterium]|nr:hypothetical protein [Burkholderiales bacterium]
GIEHHYAPLGFVAMAGNEPTATPCLCEIEPINSCSRAALNRDAPGAAAVPPAVRNKTPARTKSNG